MKAKIKGIKIQYQLSCISKTKLNSNFYSDFTSFVTNYEIIKQYIIQRKSSIETESFSNIKDKHFSKCNRKKVHAQIKVANPNRTSGNFRISKSINISSQFVYLTLQFTSNSCFLSRLEFPFSANSLQTIFLSL